MLTDKIDRAKQYFGELQNTVDSFIKDNPFVLGTKIKPDSGRLVYYLTKVNNVPTNIPLIIGDIFNNLRSSLDYLIYDLYIKNGGSEKESNHLYFPISDNFELYEKEKISKTKGIREDTIKLIDSVKPYKEGNLNLWILKKLNNLDKHRLLITVGSAYHSMDIGSVITDKFNKSFPDFKVPEMKLFIKPEDNLFPLKVGDELFEDEQYAKPNPNIQFKFNLVLNEIGVIEGESVIELVKKLIIEVENVADLFK